jgi:polyhydroxyalkanoate synthesis regulator phasin
MGLAKDLRSRGVAMAGEAVSKLFADEKRAAQIGDLLNLVQKSRKAIDEAQERALRNMGVASSGDLKAAGKRLAALRKSARKLDEKLGTLAGKVNGGT